MILSLSQAVLVFFFFGKGLSCQTIQVRTTLTGFSCLHQLSAGVTGSVLGIEAGSSTLKSELQLSCCFLFETGYHYTMNS